MTKSSSHTPPAAETRNRRPCTLLSAQLCSRKRDVWAFTRRESVSRRCNRQFHIHITSGRRVTNCVLFSDPVVSRSVRQLTPTGLGRHRGRPTWHTSDVEVSSWPACQIDRTILVYWGLTRLIGVTFSLSKGGPRGLTKRAWPLCLHWENHGVIDLQICRCILHVFDSH